MKRFAPTIVVVLSVVGCAAHSPPRSESATQPTVPSYAADDLAGQWTLTMPAGFISQVNLSAISPSELLIAAKGVLSGRYHIDGDKLSILNPNDKRLINTRWIIKGYNQIILIDSPTGFGPDYTGATLTR